jgi:integral membrane sensor domain MASE1
MGHGHLRGLPRPRLLGITSIDNRDFLAFVYSDPGRVPILLRHRADPNVQGVVKGPYTAAIIGAILGVLLGKIAIAHWLTALIAAGSPAVLFR